MPPLTTSVSGLIRQLRPLLRRHKHIKNLLKGIDEHLALIQHSTATYFPILIQPQPRQLTLAVTARCNLRCIGCRYERDYMLGQELPPHIVKTLLDDARAAGINMVRFYGGEPLLHPALPQMIEHSVRLGMETYITTNGILLKQRIDALYEAGLRWMTIGFYGTGADYNTYTQRGDQYARLEASLAAVRDRYGKAIDLQLNFVLMRPSCNLKALSDAWAFAERFDMFFHIDLVAYSLPFFTDGPDRLLQLTTNDHSAVLEVGAELIRLKKQHPDRFVHSLPFVRSIPDWLLKGAEMRIPCDAYQLIWVGADGTVQLCDAHFKLGNLHEKRLKDILYTEAHKQASRDAFSLNCPNCICKLDSRIMKHGPSRRRYSV